MHPCSNENEVEQLLVNAISDTITKSQIKIANSPSSRTLTILKIKEKMLLTLKKYVFKKTARYLHNFRITCESSFQCLWPRVTLLSISSFMRSLRAAIISVSHVGYHTKKKNMCNIFKTTG